TSGRRWGCAPIPSQSSLTSWSESTDSYQFVKEDWEAIGLRTVINPVEGTQIQSMQRTATFDIRNSWEIGDGPDHVVFPNWLVPIGWERWAPLYGNWYAVKGDRKSTRLNSSHVKIAYAVFCLKQKI